MKRAIVLAAAALTVMAGSLLLRVPASNSARVGDGAQAPALRASTLNPAGQARSIEHYRGQVVLLNVWATWCPPCLEEMPSLQALHEGMESQGLRVVAVSIDDRGSEDNIREFLREHGLTFEVLHDPAGAIMSDYQVAGVPQTFLIDRRGRIRHKSFFTDWRTPENRARVGVLLSEKA